MARAIALLLHKKLEEALDAAKIAIIPIPNPASQEPNWKAILVDKTMSNQMAYYQRRGKTKWKVSMYTPQFHTRILSCTHRTSMARSLCF